MKICLRYLSSKSPLSERRLTIASLKESDVINYDNLSVREIKSSTLRRSGRSSKTGSATNSASCSSDHPIRSALALISGLREFLRVLRRWLKPVFTTFLNNASSQPSSVRWLRTSLMTADFTFGGGLNAHSPTVKRYSMSYHA